MASQLIGLFASGIEVLQDQYLAQSGNSCTLIYLINSGLRQFIPMKCLGNWLRADCVCVCVCCGAGEVVNKHTTTELGNKGQIQFLLSLRQCIQYSHIPQTPLGNLNNKTTKNVNIILCTPTNLG